MYPTIRNGKGRRKGLGTVVGTVIFLLIALGAIALIGVYLGEETYFGQQFSAAQVAIGNHNQESLSVHCNQVISTNPAGNPNNGIGKAQIIGITLTVKNQGQETSTIQYIVMAVNNNNIPGQLVYITPSSASSNTNPPLPYLLGPGQSVTFTISQNSNPQLFQFLNGNPNGYIFGVVTAYGNTFWSNGVG